MYARLFFLFTGVAYASQPNPSVATCHPETAGPATCSDGEVFFVEPWRVFTFPGDSAVSTKEWPRKIAFAVGTAVHAGAWKYWSQPDAAAPFPCLCTADRTYDLIRGCISEIADKILINPPVTRCQLQALASGHLLQYGVP